MLKPTVYVLNKSSAKLTLPVADEAYLQPIEWLHEIKDGRIVLLITDNAEDITRCSDGRARVYFVYVGDNYTDVVDMPCVLDAAACFEDFRASDKIILRWVRIIVRDYLADLYKLLLQTLIDSSPDMVWFKDEDERHVILNRAFCDVVGKDYEFCLNKMHPDIWDISWDEYESSDFACRQSEMEVIRTGKTGIFQEPVLAHGEMRQLTTYKTPIYDSFGNILGTCGIGHDVTNVNNMGKELDIFLQAIPYPAFLCSREHKILRMNSAAKGLVHMQGSEISNYKTWKDLFLKKEKDSRTGAGRVYVSQLGSSRTYYSVIERDVKDFFGNVTGRFCMLRDVTYQCMYDDLMFKAANVDPLTGAYNRRFFYETMEGYVGKPLTLLYMDLDNFKRVNDLYGHTKGDEVLIGVARIIRKEFPEYALVRLGGDEFALLIPVHESFEQLKDRLDVITGEIQTLADKDTMLGISIGYETTENLKDVEELMSVCDRRMYEKKHRGCSAATFVPPLHEAMGWL